MRGLVPETADLPPCPVREDLEQMPCTPATRQRRADLLREWEGPRLLLGDDDLVSTLLEADVMELDPALLSLLPHAQRWDLRDPLPPARRGGYRVVSLDPPYAWDGFRTFLTRAREAVAPDGRVALHTNLELAQAPAWEDLGFSLLETRRDFSQYATPDSYRHAARTVAARFGVPFEVLDVPVLSADLFVLSAR